MKRGALRGIHNQELLRRASICMGHIKRLLDKHRSFLNELRRREKLPPMPSLMDDPRGSDMWDEELGPPVDEKLRGGGE